jgi:release factor glutamine methyltransferase
VSLPLQGASADSVQGWLRQAERQLQAHSDSPRLDAELLLAHCLGITRSALYARGDEPVGEDRRIDAERLLQRRLAGEPVAYLRGLREFYSLELRVTADVLIPRPETELLVDLALQALRGVPHPRVLDLGCGSGALALAIASQRRDAQVIATDCSDAALAVARRNAERLRLPLDLRQGDWYAAIAHETFDVIVCNPPYVGLEDSDLAADVRRYEPALALFAGSDGLIALRRVIIGAADHLHAHGVLLLEHGARQGDAVRALCTQAGLQDIHTEADAAGHERATRARRAS